MEYRNANLKKSRENYICKVIDKIKLKDNFILLTIKLPYNLIHSLECLENLILLRNPAFRECLNLSINTLKIDKKNSTISIPINTKKTKNINELNVNDNVLVKIPCGRSIINFNRILNKNVNEDIILSE